MNNKSIKVVDLFAGIGGLKQGALAAVTDAGFKHEIVFTSEIKKDAIKTLQANWPEDIVSGDITKIKEEEVPSHDLLLAGFPCQAFSFAGNRKGFDDTRGTLFFDVLRILKYHRPSFFVLENVEGLIKHDPDPEDKKAPIGRTLRTILAHLNELGYSVDWRLLNATNFGVPQLRKRIFIVGSLKGEVSFDKVQTTPASGLKSILEANPVVASLTPAEKKFQDALLKNYSASSLIGKKIGNKRGGSNNIHTWDFDYHGETTNDEKKLLNTLLLERRKRKYAVARGIPDKDGIPLRLEEISEFYDGSEPLSEVLASLVNRKYLTAKHGGFDIAGGKLSFPYSQILNPELNAPTIVASDAERLAVVHNGKLRRLTEVEFKRLFGFSVSFVLPESVSKRAVYDLFGNSVVIPMAKAATSLLFV